MSSSLPVLAILGGTGELGSGLALRWATAGYRIVIGSRDTSKAISVAQRHCETLYARGNVSVDIIGMDNQLAAQTADIVALTVPYGHHRSTLKDIKSALDGKILVDVTVPLVAPNVARVQLPPEGSAGQIAQQLLGENVQVVSAFQNVAAHHLLQDRELTCDVLVCGNSKDARMQVIRLVDAAGLRGIHAGSINNAAAVEALTSLLIFINRQYQCHSGISITGLDDDGE